eukprot:76216-Karenia_brevis.AAC.1
MFSGRTQEAARSDPRRDPVRILSGARWDLVGIPVGTPSGPCRDPVKTPSGSRRVPVGCPPGPGLSLIHI